MTDQRPAPVADFVVYGKPACPQCRMTERELGRHDVTVRKVDVKEDEAAYRYITEKLQYLAAPVVVTAWGEHWSGFDPDKILAAVVRVKEGRSEQR